MATNDQQTITNDHKWEQTSSKFQHMISWGRTASEEEPTGLPPLCLGGNCPLEFEQIPENIESDDIFKEP